MRVTGCSWMAIADGKQEWQVGRFPLRGRADLVSSHGLWYPQGEPSAPRQSLALRPSRLGLKMDGVFAQRRSEGRAFLIMQKWSPQFFTLLSIAGLLLAIVSLRGASKVFLFQTATDVPPDATPQISKITPDHAAPGEQVSLVVTGTNFSSGAYVSASSPFVHVVSSERVSATELHAQLAVGAKAEAGTVTLYVSNPASIVAQSPFTIAASAPPAPPPPSPVVTPAPTAPEVSKVSPASLGQGSQTTVKVTGKNFAPGVKVSFANPGIRVISIAAQKNGDLEVSVQVAADAPTGATSLFVVNADDSEAEAAFEVTTASPTITATTTTTTPKKTTTAAGGAAAGEQTFEVYNLGDAVSILQSGGQSKGKLIVGGGKLRYQESDQVVFSASAKEVREVGVNTFYGLSTRTFHIILTSGKRYNFSGGDLKQDESQAMVDAIQTALR
jgi:quinohemoprotein amine dehydrogenase alpha subunit-like protein